MSKLVEFAKSEMERLGWFEPDEDGDLMQKGIADDILEMIEAFSKQGHSGFSASYALSVFDRLARYKPIAPITDEDGWTKYADGHLQHKRCSSVFKDSEDEQPYYIKAVVFVDSNGCSYATKDSTINIDFPFMEPDKPEYIYLDENGNVIRRENSWWQEKYGHLNKGHKYA